MKKFIVGCFLLSGFSAFSQQHILVKKWETDSLLKTPESVLYVEKDKILYVSNIDGAPDGRDGKGSIGKIGLDGKIIAVDWVKGLDAPKGMGLYKNKLYVADLTQVVVIDVLLGKIIEYIPVDKAVFLNDITVDKKGIVYVSDTKTGIVHRIDGSHVTTIVEKLKGPNGLLAVDNDLMILDNGNLFKKTADGAIASIADGMDPSTDGIEMVKPGEYLVSCWSGIVYYVWSNGNKQTLFDTRAAKINSADIGYDAKNRIVYVPTFYKNKVVAYELK